MIRLLHRLHGRRCPICRIRLRANDGIYCSAHTNIQITQYEESRR